MTHTKNRYRSTFIIGLIILIILIVLALIMAGRTLHLISAVQQEAALTPTPVPVMQNVMHVTPDPNLATPEPLIKAGAQGDSVAQIQQRLSDLGYYHSSVDGQFGRGTTDAVLWFQTQHGLDADGIIGPMTKELLFSNTAQTAVSTPAPSASPTISQAFIAQNNLPMLVNKDFPIADDYTPSNLVKMNDVCDSNLVIIKHADTYANKEAVDALMTMLRAAHADGETVWQVSAAYRTYAMQEALFDEQVQTYMKENGLSEEKARSATKQTVAVPGTSEHHTGLAFDLTVPGKYFQDTTQSKWLEANCWDYGFIMRYQADKQGITGFLAEAWHVRYVGRAHALSMRDDNLCLEEYLLLKQGN